MNDRDLSDSSNDQLRFLDWFGEREKESMLLYFSLQILDDSIIRNCLFSLATTILVSLKIRASLALSSNSAITGTNSPQSHDCVGNAPHEAGVWDELTMESGSDW
jgi:hypothetical protein